MRGPMRLTHLSLTNFRNFVRLETDFSPGSTLLMGANAQGKSSLLEAVYILSGAASPHASSDRQLINFLAFQEPTPFVRIVAETRRQDLPQRIEIRIVEEAAEPGEAPRLRKEVLVNGVRRPARQLAGSFTAVLFQPRDLQVIEGSPGDRRRFLDEALAQADPVYGEALSRYGKTLANRNALLKQIQEAGNSSSGDQLDFWDEQLADLAAALIRSRSLALRELEHLAQPIHTDLTQGSELLRLEYLPSYQSLPLPQGQLGLPLDAPTDRPAVGHEDLRDGLRTTLRNTRSDDIARGLTLIGPHRDDFRIRASGIDLTTYGSRGQDRTAILALKLAEIEWIRQRTGEWPVLLLDEVLAELDASRRASLLGRIHSAEQAILTSADLGMFAEDFRSRATIWEISAGTLRPLGAR
jgi:DNA replication and repair protein RecF